MPSRRRGRALEDALLDAAWEQLKSTGYAGFTIDAVAARAGTSKPVIYRRWNSREDLALATVQHAFDTASVVEVPDTGTLRGDVLALLHAVNQTRVAFAAMISVQLASYFQEASTTPAALRAIVLGERASVMTRIVERAIAWGEVDPDRLTPRITPLPFDLLRQEVMMTFEAVPDETLAEIVDQIFLPLVRPQNP